MDKFEFLPDILSFYQVIWESLVILRMSFYQNDATFKNFLPSLFQHLKNLVDVFENTYCKGKEGRNHATTFNWIVQRAQTFSILLSAPVFSISDSWFNFIKATTIGNEMVNAKTGYDIAKFWRGKKIFKR